LGFVERDPLQNRVDAGIEAYGVAAVMEESETCYRDVMNPDNHSLRRAVAMVAIANLA
jgi:hypothetical protein